MSKMDELRALREARYAREAARGAGRPRVAPKPPEAPEPSGQAPRPAPAETAPGAAGDAAERLCGHRAISGRTCTREHGHAAKSHRYA